MPMTEWLMIAGLALGLFAIMGVIIVATKDFDDKWGD